MALQIHQLPTSETIPSGAYMLLKRDVLGNQLDYKIDIGSLFSPYINRNTEVGTGIGNFIQLIDVAGNAGLPAVDGSQLTNIFPDRASDVQFGVTKLSDSTNSTLNAAVGETAATPKAIRDMGLLKLSLTGGELTGDLTLINNRGINIRDTLNNVKNAITLDGSNDILIGDTGVSDTSIQSQNTINFKDNSGVTVFSFNVSTGGITGINASAVGFTPTGTIAASDVQNALVEVANEAVSTTGDNLTGTLVFNNSTGIDIRNTATTPLSILKLDSANDLLVGSSGVSDTSIQSQNTISFKNGSGTELFGFNLTTGALNGFGASEIDVTPTGSIAATDVQSAITELDSEKVSKTGDTLTGDLNFTTGNGIKFDSYPVEYVNANGALQIGDATLLHTDILVQNSIRFKNTAGSTIFEFSTASGTITGINADDIPYTPTGDIGSNNVQAAITELDLEKLGIGGTAVNSTSLGGIAASSYTREDITSNRTASMTFDNGSQILMGTGQNIRYGSSAAENYIQLHANDLNIKDQTFSTIFSFERSTGNFNSQGSITANGLNITGGAITGFSATDITNTPSGSISATNVQAALTELDSEKLSVNAQAADSLLLGGIDPNNFARRDVPEVFINEVTFSDDISINNTTVKDNKALYFGNDGFNDSYFLYQSSTNQLFLNLNTNATRFIIREGASARFTFEKSTGNFTATGNITANSDLTVKENFEVISNPLDKVKRLTGFTFDRTDMVTARQTGLIAQDVIRVLPEAVSEGQDGKLSVAYGNLVGLLVEAIKELSEEVETLKGKVI